MGKDYKKLASTMEQQSQQQSQEAVENYKTAEQRMKGQIFEEMAGKLPQMIRQVLGKALTRFQDGKVTRDEVNNILRKSFSDKTFDDVLLCI